MPPRLHCPPDPSPARPRPSLDPESPHLLGVRQHLPPLLLALRQNVPWVGPGEWHRAGGAGRGGPQPAAAAVPRVVAGRGQERLAAGSSGGRCSVVRGLGCGACGLRPAVGASGCELRTDAYREMQWQEHLDGRCGRMGKSWRAVARSHGATQSRGPTGASQPAPSDAKKSARDNAPYMGVRLP